MLVMKLWITEKKKFHTVVVRNYWKGYFLFGVLPLYIELMKAEYPLGYDRR